MNQTQSEIKREFEQDWKEVPNSTAKPLVTEKMREEYRNVFGLDSAYDTDDNVYNWYYGDRNYIKSDKAVVADTSDRNEPENDLPSKYHRHCNKNVIDVYDVLDMYKITNQAMGHAIKKMLMTGKRGTKSYEQDAHEAIQAIYRAIELEKKQ